ncbi:hypothetical protein KY290_038413 [Solanum tuberosum]|uniref:Uncharacterized protein n=1 Tax=Solanum tuberosum TaxID=4113 RepID=A0ABQ7TYZ0_SOLTU|nr:hypothetical protein KY289_036678 [Solanum tuberosum]KAH0639888.1 hypothetical protein KY285_036474 [Solanum tuberosum]KAH0739708.1 hypothetical protein KY290_038413 [Solanum tuberosum]
MQICQDKSQEELRFEDYQLGDKGQKYGYSFTVSNAHRDLVSSTTRGFSNHQHLVVYKTSEALLLWCYTSKLLLPLQPLLFVPLQPELTPKVGATLPTTNVSHPSNMYLVQFYRIHSYSPLSCLCRPNILHPSLVIV